MSTRRKSRETALQILYKADVSGSTEAGNYSGEMEKLIPGTEARAYCEELVTGVLARINELDDIIEGCSDNWKVDRMGLVDRNVLRLAVYELVYCPATPFKAVIDEAVELARRYCGEEAGAFINGVLDKVHRQTPPGAVNAR